jgi:CheY-like chemotaxis protein
MSDDKTRILVVDDDRLVRTSMAMALAEIGYSVRTAYDGFSALEDLREHLPEILLTDLKMPGISGFELLTIVRRRYPAVRTIAMSGAFHGNEVPSGVAADAFFQKGSSMASLRIILSSLPQSDMDNSQSRRPHQAEGMPQSSGHPQFN